MANGTAYAELAPAGRSAAEEGDDRDGSAAAEVLTVVLASARSAGAHNQVQAEPVVSLNTQREESR